MKPKDIKQLHRHGGLTLIEVLVTVVILLVGLLGTAVLLASSQKAETEAYQRAHALVLLKDMATRINANRAVAPCYAITDAGQGEPFLGTGSVLVPACGLGSPAAYTLAVQDLTDWNDLLLGATETLDGDSVGTLTGARGCVTADMATMVFTITVVWQGLSPTAEPDDPCGAGEYGGNGLRRAVSTVVQIADLG